MAQPNSVLILGGSGQAGAGAAAVLRRWHPELPLTIAGRDLGRAQRVADELGAATAATVDLRRGDLGLPADGGYLAVVAALWDDRLQGLRYAQERGLPYLSISSGLVDIAPEIVASAQRPSSPPVLVASHFCAGIGVLATLHATREFERIDTIRIGAVLDELDAGGPRAWRTWSDGPPPPRPDWYAVTACSRGSPNPRRGRRCRVPTGSSCPPRASPSSTCRALPSRREHRTSASTSPSVSPRVGAAAAPPHSRSGSTSKERAQEGNRAACTATSSTRTGSDR